MRVRIPTAVTALALALTIVAAMGTGAGARPLVKPSAVSHRAARTVHPHSIAGAIYSQLDNDNGIGLTSQHFESSLNAYDAQGADDFKIRKHAKIKKVFVIGTYFNCSTCGPAESVHVTFYKNAAGKPGAVVKDYPRLGYSDSAGTGTFTIKTPTTKLSAGTYWVSVYANMHFATGGQWGWNTNNTVRNSPSQWQNPGNGFGSGCTTWGTTTTCEAQGEGGDFSFALIGKGH
jgi:hypothetical protein